MPQLKLVQLVGFALEYTVLKLAAVSQRVPDFLSSLIICSTKESGDGWRIGVFIPLINRLNECET